MTEPARDRVVALVRHGRTFENDVGVYAGRSNGGLTQVGRHQADVVAERLRALGFAEGTPVMSSPQPRAKETAMVLASHLGSQVIEELLLDELDFGLWTGRTAAEISAEFPAEWNTWRTNPGGARPTGGESLVDLADRCAIAVGHMAIGTIAVSHETAIRACLCSVTGASLSRYRAWSIKPGTGVLVNVARGEILTTF